LSRLLGETAKTERHIHNSEEYVRFIAVNATPNALTTREVERASESDMELKEVRFAINSGHFENCKAYAPIANELCCIGHLVLRGTRIVIPKALQPRALALVHEGHLGIVGTKQHLRSKVWWPGMDKAAEKFCKSCHGCQVVCTWTTKTNATTRWTLAGCGRRSVRTTPNWSPLMLKGSTPTKQPGELNVNRQIRTPTAVVLILILMIKTPRLISQIHQNWINPKGPDDCLRGCLIMS